MRLPAKQLTRQQPSAAGAMSRVFRAALLHTLLSPGASMRLPIGRSGNLASATHMRARPPVCAAEEAAFDMNAAVTALNAAVSNEVRTQTGNTRTRPLLAKWKY